MYAMIRRYVGDTALADRLAEHSDEIGSLMNGIAGFRAYYLVRSDTDTASVTICDDQAGAKESSRLAANWLRENMPDATTAPPQMTAGEVVVNH